MKSHMNHRALRLVLLNRMSHSYFVSNSQSVKDITYCWIVHMSWLLSPSKNLLFYCILSLSYYFVACLVGVSTAVSYHFYTWFIFIYWGIFFKIHVHFDLRISSFWLERQLMLCLSTDIDTCWDLKLMGWSNK